MQVDIKGKKKEWFTGFGRCKACKMYWTEANNCTRKPPEKNEVKEGQKCPRPAGPKALGRPAWPLFMPSGAPLWQVCSSLISLLMFFKFFAQKHQLEP